MWVSYSGKINALIEFQMSEINEKRDMRLISKTKYVVFFLKIDHNDIVLCWMTWSGKTHALLAFQGSCAYKSQSMCLTPKTKYAVLFSQR